MSTLFLVLFFYIATTVSCFIYIYFKLNALVLTRVNQSKQLPAKKSNSLIVQQKDIDIYADKISKFLFEKTGIVAKDHHNNRIKLSLPERMKKYNYLHCSDYYKLLISGDKNEINFFISLSTTNYTFFFREMEQIKTILNDLPRIVSKIESSGGETLHFWSAACSKGHEVYTLAILLKEELIQLNSSLDLEMIGTDVDTLSIDIAKKGVYSSKEVKNIPSHLLKKYFLKGKGNASNLFKIKDEIKNLCKFEIHNLKNNFNKNDKFHFIFLRNVLIYFNNQLVEKVINQLKSNLSNEGLLVTGISEPLELSKYQNLTKISNSVYIMDDKTVNKMISPPLKEFQSTVNMVYYTNSKNGELIQSLVNQDFQNVNISSIGNLNEIGKALKEVDIFILDIDGVANVNDIVNNCIFKYGVDLIICTNKDLNTDAEMFDILNLGVRDFLSKSEKGIVSDVKLSHVIKRLITNNSIHRQPLHFDLSIPIFIGASTGGIKALKSLFQRFPAQIPPIVVVQHMPKKYSKDFSERLNLNLPYTVVEGKDGDRLRPNQIIIARGGKHLTVVKSKDGHMINLKGGEKVCGFKPSVDVMFESVAENFTGPKIGLLLTGMGKDGAKGLLKLRQVGAKTIAQGKQSSVVYGMPQQAIKLGAADTVIDLDKIPQALATISTTVLSPEKKSA